MFIIILLALWFLLLVIWPPKAVGSEESPSLSCSTTQSVPIVHSKEWVTSVIIAKATEYHIDTALFLRVATCESGLRTNAQNKISTASGIFQFLDGTFNSQYQKYFKVSPNMELKNDPLIQIDLAARMIADGGLSHWNASKACWQ